MLARSSPTTSIPDMGARASPPAFLSCLARSRIAAILREVTSQMVHVPPCGGAPQIRNPKFKNFFIPPVDTSFYMRRKR